ncbi:MAG TPA: HDOD domain-containing protein [Deltaproteobacteria bacterium]|nr:HDOD domain-containing protein [Deltaproteobacteria bacterium]
MTREHALIRKFNNIKTLPHVAIRLSKLLSNENNSFKDMEEVIRLDPTLVLRVLRIVNSAYYGLKQKVDSIERAVVFIGMRNLRNMVVTEALKDIFRMETNGQVYSRRQLWLHCAAVSICGHMIGERIFGQKGEDVFLCGILHDIGIIVEDQVARKSFIETCNRFQLNSRSFVDHENEVIGTNHCAVGYELSREWSLPVTVQEAIRDHHRLSHTISPSSVTGILQISEYIVSRMNYTAMPGMKETLSAQLLDHLVENIGEYKTLIRDLPDEMVKARELYDPEKE